jgi:hypothetical protein
MKEAIEEERGGQPRDAPRILTFSFQHGKPRCILILSYALSFIILCLQMYCALTYRY